MYWIHISQESPIMTKTRLPSFYHLDKGSVYGFALSMLKNTEDAEDVLQDTYLSIYASASGYRSMGKPRLDFADNSEFMFPMKLAGSQEDCRNTFRRIEPVV